MEGMVKHNEVISMQIFQTWKHIMVTINGMSFNIYEENIARARDFSLDGKR